MTSGSTEETPRQTKRLQSAVLSIFISLISVGGTVVGFLIGRNTNQDAYVKKVSTIIATENSMMSLYEAVRPQIDDPVTAQALAKLYDVRLYVKTA